MFGIPAGRVLAAGAVLGLISLGLFPALEREPVVASISIAAANHTLSVKEQFTVALNLNAREPVNAFKGILTFDPSRLTIVSISYNTSVADLWAEEPWYSNGDGTLTFIGGTTRPGGFTGSEQILAVTFEAVAAGDTALAMQQMRIIRHDGLGTDAPVSEPIDTLFEVTPEQLAAKTVSEKEIDDGPTLSVLPTRVSTDLNGDGKQSIADTSIFMTHLATQNPRSDFNRDGSVNLQDLSILNQQ